MERHIATCGGAAARRARSSFGVKISISDPVADRLLCVKASRHALKATPSSDRIERRSATSRAGCCNWGNELESFEVIGNALGDKLANFEIESSREASQSISDFLQVNGAAPCPTLGSLEVLNRVRY